MTPPEREPGLAVYRGSLVLAGLLWSLGGVLIKLLTAHPVFASSAIGITFHRSLFAAVALLPLAAGRRLPPVRDLAVSILLYAVMLACYVASAQGTTAANAIFLQYTAPLYAMVLGPIFFGEPFRRADLLALAIAMTGVGVLFFGSFSGGERLPLLLGAASGALFGLFLLWLRRMREADPIAVTAWNNAGVALVSGVVLWAVRPEEAALVVRPLAGETALLGVVALLAIMGVFQIAAPYSLFSFGLRRVPGVEASLLALVEPMVTPIWVALVVRESPTPPTVAGGALILLALAARYLLPLRERSPQATSAGER